jgi:hypothetical protein
MASTSYHPATLAARLLGDHKDHNNTDTATATLMAQSADTGSSTTTNLFPTTTAGRGDSVAGPGSANVYYLVVSTSSGNSHMDDTDILVSRCACDYPSLGGLPCIQGI